MIVLHKWITKQIDYIQDFPQAPAEKDLYLKVPAGFEVEGWKKGDRVQDSHEEQDFWMNRLDSITFLSSFHLKTCRNFQV